MPTSRTRTTRGDHHVAMAARAVFPAGHDLDAVRRRLHDAGFPRASVSVEDARGLALHVPEDAAPLRDVAWRAALVATAAVAAAAVVVEDVRVLGVGLLVLALLVADHTLRRSRTTPTSQRTSHAVSGTSLVTVRTVRGVVAARVLVAAGGVVVDEPPARPDVEPG